MKKADLLTVHAHCVPCLHEHLSGTCYVYEEPTTKRCHIRAVGEEEEADFVVSSSAVCHIVAVDNCVLDRTGGEKCDCLVFTDDTVCLIEIKRGSRRNLGRDLKKGAKQVGNTIKRFRADALLVSGDVVVGIVSTKRAQFLSPQLSTFRQNTLVGLKEDHAELELDFRLADEVTL